MDIEVKAARYNIRSISDLSRPYGNNVYQNGEDNRFSDYLDSLSNSSVTHQDIINDLIDYVYGKGLRTVNPSEQELLDKFFPKGKTKRIIRSKLVQAAINIEVMKSQLGNVLSLKFIHASQIRVSQLHHNKPVGFVFRKSWDQNSYQAYQITKELNRITPNKFEGLFYWYDSGTFDVPYGRPKYISGLNAIELEASIYLMHNTGAQNGMFPSMLISKVTCGDPEKDKADAEATINQLSGASVAGKVAFDYRPAGAENTTTFTTPNLTGLDKIYENQYQVAEIGILKAWQIPSPTLISGLNTKGSGFSSPAEEMEFALKILQKKRIEPEREELLDILNPLFEMIGIQSEVEFVGEETTITSAPIVDEETGVVTEAPAIDDSVLVDKEASYNGAQIASALEIMESVNTGLLTKKQAEKFLIQMLQFSPALAASLFEGGLDGVNEVENLVPLEETKSVNESIKNLTGRQMQGIERIVRKFTQGKLNKEQAKLMLMSGFGFDEAEALVWLNDGTELSVSLRKIILSKPTDFDDQCMLDALEVNEVINFDEWELVDTREENGQDCKEWANSLIKVKSSAVQKLADFIKSNPNGESFLDESYYKIRYTYQSRRGGGTSGKTRRFCNQMMSRTGRGVVYRKEDIDKASFQGVNNELGHKGQNYSLFRFKGGVNCGHYWQEELYRMKSKTEKYISKGKEVSSIPSSYQPKGKQYSDAETIPYNMPNHGHHPNYNK